MNLWVPWGNLEGFSEELAGEGVPCKSMDMHIGFHTLSP